MLQLTMTYNVLNNNNEFKKLMLKADNQALKTVLLSSVSAITLSGCFGGGGGGTFGAYGVSSSSSSEDVFPEEEWNLILLWEEDLFQSEEEDLRLEKSSSSS